MMGPNDTTITAGEPVPPLAPVIPPGYREFVLPSGARAVVLVDSRGRHLKLVMRLASAAQQEPAAAIWAHICVKVTIEGRALTMEDVDDMLERDITFLTPLMTGNDPASASTT